MLGAALGIGCVVGALLAARVAMTSMPELVAMLHSFVGAAAVLVGIATYLQPGAEIAAARSVHLVEIFVGVLVGAVTFSGSIVAFGKLRGMVGSKPLLLPGRHAAESAAARAAASCWACCSCARPSAGRRRRRAVGRRARAAAGDDGAGAGCSACTW